LPASRGDGGSNTGSPFIFASCWFVLFSAARTHPAIIPLNMGDARMEWLNDLVWWVGFAVIATTAAFVLFATAVTVLWRTGFFKADDELG
jgi:hypothetical protein